VTKNGYIKKTAMAEYANVRRNGLIAINLQEGDELDWVTPTTGSDEVIIATELGKAIRFSETEVRAMGRDTQGVIGIKLGKGDAVAGMATVIEGGDLLVITQGVIVMRLAPDDQVVAIAPVAGIEESDSKE